MTIPTLYAPNLGLFVDPHTNSIDCPPLTYRAWRYGAMMDASTGKRPLREFYEGMHVTLSDGAAKCNANVALDVLGYPYFIRVSEFENILPTTDSN